MLDVRLLRLDGVFEIRPSKFEDSRGFFSETWSAERMAEAGFDMTFVQDNHSSSAAKGVLRGLHFQLPPAAQHKLIRVSKGSVFDVAVDIRRELRDIRPMGRGHAFGQALEPDAGSARLRARVPDARGT